MLPLLDFNNCLSMAVQNLGHEKANKTHSFINPFPLPLPSPGAQMVYSTLTLQHLQIDFSDSSSNVARLLRNDAQCHAKSTSYKKHLFTAL